MNIIRLGCRRLNVFSTLVSAILFSSASQADDLGNAVRAAVKQVEPCVVRLRVIGGEQSVDGDKISSLVTTGVVISDKGEILTSQFALQGNPEAVLAENQSGQRTNVEIVATDHVRRLVLLKAREGQWTAAKPAPSSSVQVGQWSIALGRFYAPDSSNISVGVVSALNRIHGMAVQSDAKISPVNYGGPLIDLQGQVLGILVPLSPRGQGNASSGIEWYDSGIGFAIPLEKALQIAERLRSGKDLKAGRLGVKLVTSGVFSSNIRVDRVVPKGPADIAGVKKGDRLISVNQRSIERMSILEETVASSYAGDVIQLAVKRGEENLSLPVELTEELPMQTPGYLGFLTVRTKKSKESGGQPANAEIARLLQGGQPQRIPVGDVPARKETTKVAGDSVPLLIANDTPASKAGLPQRIELLKINEEKTPGLAELIVAATEIQAGDKARLEYREAGESETKSSEITTAQFPEIIVPLSNDVLDAIKKVGQDTLTQIKAENAETDKAQPEAPNANPNGPSEKAKTAGDVQRRELTFEGRGRTVVFSSIVESGVLPGIVILLSAEKESEEQIFLKWKPFLDSHQLIVAIPINPENARLTADDIPLVMTTIQGLALGGKADLQRIVVVGNREQSRLAWQLVFGGPSPIRGIALTNGWISATELEGADGSDQSILLLETPKNAQSQALLTQSRDALRKAGFRVSRPTDVEAERTIANWSLLMRSF